MPSKPWYANGLRFNCTQCGNCCRNHGEYTFVYLARKDVLAIAGHLKLTPKAFIAEYCNVVDGWVTLRMDEPACRFLEEDNRCAIYPVRPKQCATWPFWEESPALHGLLTLFTCCAQNSLASRATPHRWPCAPTQRCAGSRSGCSPLPFY